MCNNKIVILLICLYHFFFILLYIDDQSLNFKLINTNFNKYSWIKNKIFF